MPTMSGQVKTYCNIIAHNVAPKLLFDYAGASQRLMGSGESNGTTQRAEKSGQSMACNIRSKTVAKKISRGAPATGRDGTSLYAADGGRKYLNLSERQRALATMATLDPDRALFAMTLAWTGARVSEVL